MSPLYRNSFVFILTRVGAIMALDFLWKWSIISLVTALLIKVMGHLSLVKKHKIFLYQSPSTSSSSLFYICILYHNQIGQDITTLKATVDCIYLLVEEKTLSFCGPWSDAYWPKIIRMHLACWRSLGWNAWAPGTLFLPYMVWSDKSFSQMLSCLLPFSGHLPWGYISVNF